MGVVTHDLLSGPTVFVATLRFSLHVRFSSGDFNVAYCILSSRGMYSLYNTW